MDPVGTSGLLRLVPYLRQAGFDCKVPDYGLITAEEARIANPLIVRSILPYIEPGDLWVGHSNGCALGYEALQAGAPLAGLVLINAALKRDIELPAGVWAHVYYNAGDDATLAAEAGRRLGLTDPNWGDMGHFGYLGDNPNVMAVDCANRAGMPRCWGHSDLFSPVPLPAWGPYIPSRMNVRVGRAVPG